MKKFNLASLLKSLVLIAVGLLLIFMAEATLVSISYLFGGVLIAIGAVAVIQFFKVQEEKKIWNQFNIVYGIITILAGIVLIIKPNIVGSLVPIFLGLGMIVSSSFKLQQALTFKNSESSYWKASLITSLLCLICGLVILFNPFKTAAVVTQMIGIFILIYAFLDILSNILLSKNTVGIEIEITSQQPKKEKKKKKVNDAKIVKEVKKEE